MSTRYRSYKTASFIFVALLALFVLFNLAIWKGYTEDLLSNTKYFDGDMTRTGYIAGSKLYRVNKDDLPRRHLEFDQYHGQPVDIVTVGDSFSNGGGGGLNRYYQDFICTLSGKTVLNLLPYKLTDPITSVAIIANNGVLDRIKPKYVIVELLEKDVADQMGKPLDLDLHIDPVQAGGQASYYFGERPSPGFINQGNFKFVLYTLLYRFSDHACGMSKVYMKKLDRPLFSVPNADRLLFYGNDVHNISHATPARMKQLNDNLNALAAKLAPKGIQLCFMPVVDKYDLYNEFIIDNRYPRSTFFPQLRALPKQYRLIDTKALLEPELRKGVLDVFYPDDGHWSWKASQKIFEQVAFPE